MRRLSIMLVAGEPSGDLLAAELVTALREGLMDQACLERADLQASDTSLEPDFFGAGGPKMQAAGVQLLHDLTVNSVIGPSDVIAHYAAFRRIFRDLLSEVKRRQPDVIVLVDFSHFNQRLGEAIRKQVETTRGASRNWRPLLIKYVSPQVWASRPWRALGLARTFDLLLCILPFEEAWYAKHVPQLETVYVGHWIMDRYPPAPLPRIIPGETPLVVLLPGSRSGEIRRHASIMIDAVAKLRAQIPIRVVMVLPNTILEVMVRSLCPHLEGIDIKVGGLAYWLSQSTLGIAATGSVTLECARFELPTVAIYRTSWLTYEVAKRLVTVSYLAMPNLLAEETLFPELIQGAATPQAVSQEAFKLLTDEPRRMIVKRKLRDIVKALGDGGSSHRAAKHIIRALRKSRIDAKT